MLVGQRRFYRVTGCRNGRSTFLLVRNGKSSAHFFFASRFNSGGQVRVINRLEIKRLFCGVFGQINDQVDNRLDLLVREFHCTQHFFFRQLVRFGFNHHHCVFGASDNQIKTLFWV